MKIGIVCYPTFGGSGVVATELGKALALKGGHLGIAMDRGRVVVRTISVSDA